MENQSDTKKASVPPATGEKRPKLTAADIKTPTGSRQDILDEFSRLVKELDENQKIGRSKFNKQVQNKNIQHTKAMEPNIAADVGSEMPIDGDYAQGSRVFMRYCASCHSLEAGNQGLGAVMGPPLGLVYGRKAGSDKYFDYTESYIRSEKYWTEKNLFHYLRNPKKDFPDSRCNIKNGGLSEEEDRADVSKFLRLFTKNLRYYLNNKAQTTFDKQYIDSYNRSQTKLNESSFKNISRSSEKH